MFCFKCGSEIDGRSTFCSGCGARISADPECSGSAKKRVFIISCACVIAGVIGAVFGAASTAAYFYSAAPGKANFKIVSSVINDLRQTKSASLLYYGDNLAWPRLDWADGTSLDRYLEFPLFGADPDGVMYGFSIIQITRSTGDERTLIGFDLETGENSSRMNSGVREALAREARESRLLNENGDRYDGGRFIYVFMK